VLPFGCSHSSPMAFSSVVSVNHPLDLIPLDLFLLYPLAFEYARGYKGL